MLLPQERAVQTAWQSGRHTAATHTQTQRYKHTHTHDKDTKPRGRTERCGDDDKTDKIKKEPREGGREGRLRPHRTVRAREDCGTKSEIKDDRVERVSGRKGGVRMVNTWGQMNRKPRR